MNYKFLSSLYYRKYYSNFQIKTPRYNNLSESYLSEVNFEKPGNYSVWLEISSIITTFYPEKSNFTSSLISEMITVTIEERNTHPDTI